MEDKLNKLRLWAENCPENYRNRQALVLAEVARIEGRDLDAMRLYEEAIQSARQNGFIQNEAIAHEVAARFYLGAWLRERLPKLTSETRATAIFAGALSVRCGRSIERLPSAHRGAKPFCAPTTIETSVEQLDLGTVMKASQAVSGEIVLEKLIKTLMVIAVEHAGAERGLLILPHGEELRIAAEARTGCERGRGPDCKQASVTPSDLPDSLLRYVIRTQESVILDDASVQNLFSEDEYVRQERPRSILCLPLVKQARLMGVLYLENNLAPGVFTPNAAGHAGTAGLSGGYLFGSCPTVC